MQEPPPTTLLISILTLGRPQNVLRQLEYLPTWLSHAGGEGGFSCHIVVRNNDPNVDFSDVAALLQAAGQMYPEIASTLVTGGPNIGFGRGHNENFKLVPSDYLLILNDDIGFPHISWLAGAIASLQAAPQTACVGASENPQYLNPTFGNGLFPDSFHVETLKYAEASILLFDSGIFERIGMFYHRIEWAMCEDADLSLRAQQLGYTLKFVPMPHQHWRSTSFNSLPGEVKASILEHNRAVLFANWRETMATGRIGGVDVFDLWSDGVGDVFCCLPHLYAELSRYSVERLAHVVVNTSHPELVRLLGLDRLLVTSFREISDLRSHLGTVGISTVRTMRDVNFSLPMNIHVLLAAALGVPIADAAGMARFAAVLRAVRPLHLPVLDDYCVLHLEFKRTHDGRGLSAAAARDLVRACARQFTTIVAVGTERRLTADLCGDLGARFIDLQGNLSIPQLVGVIGGAAAFAGIDSFPAHVAQAAGVRAAVFFGSIHPLARAWDERLLWPIVAALDCIGCYHVHLEPSVPFCMRRDQMCTTQAACADLDATLQAMVVDESFDWKTMQDRLRALQTKMVTFMRHHPAPPERMLRRQGAGNEQVSTLIYRVTEQVSDLLRTQYQSAAVDKLAEQVRQLQSEVFSRDIDMLALKASHLAASIAAQPHHPAQEPRTQILQLCNVPLQPVRCRLEVANQWMHVEGLDSDPQLLFPPITGCGGRLHLRLSYDAAVNETLQILWDTEDAGFCEERTRSVAVSPSVGTTDMIFDVADGGRLRLRIDPSTEAIRMRLRGSIGGAFRLAEPDDPAAASVPVMAPLPQFAGLPAGGALDLLHAAKPDARKRRR